MQAPWWLGRLLVVTAVSGFSFNEDASSVKWTGRVALKDRWFGTQISVAKRSIVIWKQFWFNATTVARAGLSVDRNLSFSTFIRLKPCVIRRTANRGYHQAEVPLYSTIPSVRVTRSVRTKPLNDEASVFDSSISLS
mmetsp:Transcript_13417/g.27351  ORF Transcript_13417/g.27351 Transcript_13417/m.27351 type:complete len:137 (-) Transcript_13417:4360-4770(-)